MTTPSQTSAFDYLRTLLNSWGLGSLSGVIQGYIQQGMSDDEILLNLRQTPEYKVRFAGNIERQKNGLRVLSEGEYLDKETALRAQLSDPTYGLPKSYYDNYSDFAALIGGDVGAAEIQGRLEAVKSVVTDGALNGVLAWGMSNYGWTQGDMMAYFMDPTKVASTLVRQAHAAQIGGAASRSGWGNISTGDAERLNAEGITADQAQAGYSQAAQELELTQDTGTGSRVSKDDLTSGIFEQNADAIQKVAAVKDARLAAFKNGGGFAETQKGVMGLGSANT